MLFLDKRLISFFRQKRLTTWKKEDQWKTPFQSTVRKTESFHHYEFLYLIHSTNPLSCCKVTHLEWKFNKFPIMFAKLCFDKYYCVSTSILKVIKVFHIILTFFTGQSGMRETKTVLFSLSLFLLVGAGFCIYQIHTEKMWDTRTEQKLMSKSFWKRVQWLPFERQTLLPSWRSFFWV